MPEKRTHKMSRRRFLQVGLATLTSIGAGFAARWMRLSQTTPSETVNCTYSWASATLRLNEASSIVLYDSLLADGLVPEQAEVYDRAMENQTCYDVRGNVIGRELLYRDNERAIVTFIAGTSTLSEDTHSALVATVVDTLTRIDTFRVQDVEVHMTNGQDSLLWQAPLYVAQTINADEIYPFGHR